MWLYPKSTSCTLSYASVSRQTPPSFLFALWSNPRGPYLIKPHWLSLNVHCHSLGSIMIFFPHNVLLSQRPRPRENNKTNNTPTHPTEKKSFPGCCKTFKLSQYSQPLTLQRRAPASWQTAWLTSLRTTRSRSLRRLLRCLIRMETVCCALWLPLPSPPSVREPGVEFVEGFCG